jgi:hypothetical protein
MPIYKKGLSRAQQGYLFANGIGTGGFANRWYRGVKSKALPGKVRGPKSRAQSRRVARRAHR